MKWKNGLWIIASALMLVACATDTTPQEQSQPRAVAQPTKTKVNITQTKEMAYQCIIQGKQQTLRVMYGLSGQEVVLAQMSLEGQLSPILLLDKNQGPGTVFRNRGLWWISGSHDGGSGQIQSNTLVLKTLEKIDNSQMVRDHVIAQSCHFDADETARIMDRNQQMETQRTGGLIVPQAVAARP